MIKIKLIILDVRMKMKEENFLINENKWVK